MKRTFAIIGLLTFLLLPAASLSCAADLVLKVSLGQEFILPVGKTADLESEGLTIEFEEVMTDSRCAKGVECIRAGEAKCQMLITYIGSPAEQIITQPGGDTATDYFLMYKIRFQLEPYPEAGKTIAPADYYLVMTVTR